jgi:hypothetical protein
VYRYESWSKSTFCIHRNTRSIFFLTTARSIVFTRKDTGESNACTWKEWLASLCHCILKEIKKIDFETRRTLFLRNRVSCRQMGLNINSMSNRVI